MAEIVDVAIMEAEHAATGSKFNADEVAKDRLRLPSKLKGGELCSISDLKRPTFTGAIFDILPRCIVRKGPNGELTTRVYSRQLTDYIGRGAYDAEGQRKTRFVRAANMGPFPIAMQSAWQYMRLEPAHNHGLTLASSAEDWGRLGPLAEPTPPATRNRGAT